MYMYMPKNWGSVIDYEKKQKLTPQAGMIIFSRHETGSDWLICI